VTNIGQKALAAVLACIARDPARGKVFWWLYDHHDEIKAHTLGRRIPWRLILPELAALGLTNALKLTYHRVRQLKQREAEARALLSPGAALPERPRPSPASPLTQDSLFSLEEQLPGLFGPATHRGADDG
jgi:hypothetical protein